MVGNSYRIASGPLGDYIYTISRIEEISQGSWASLTFNQMILQGAPILSAANNADGMVVDSFGSVWISQSNDPGDAVQALAVSPGSGTALMLVTVASGVTVDGLGITSTFGGVGQTVLPRTPRATVSRASSRARFHWGARSPWPSLAAGRERWTRGMTATSQGRGCPTTAVSRC